MTFSQNKSYALRVLYSKLPADIRGHSIRVAIYMQMLMEQVLIFAPELYDAIDTTNDIDIPEHIREVGIYHDIGKLMIPAEILKKKEFLTPDEYEETKKHTIYIESLLQPTMNTISHGDRVFFQNIMENCRSHHEWWDGSGYPDGLSGLNIPFIARICAICDSFDAMTSMRPYSSIRTIDEALDEVIACAGTQFDPQLVHLFTINRDYLVKMKDIAHSLINDLI